METSARRFTIKEVLDAAAPGIEGIVAEIAPAIAAAALREAATEIAANIEHELATGHTHEQISNRGRKRLLGKGHRMAASLSIGRWLLERADKIEAGKP